MSEIARTPERTDSLPESPASTLGDTTRSILSIFLFVHLFILLVCFSASFVSSTLQQKLLGVFRPYTLLLNFDPSGIPLYLTHASVRDVDHRIEVLPKSVPEARTEAWESIARGTLGGERLHRYQRLADTMAFFQEDEATTALIAEAVARSYLAAEGQPIEQIRCREHTLQSWEALDSSLPEERDPNSAVYFTTVYRAEVLTIAESQVRILKRTKASLEAAPNRKADRSIDSEREQQPGSAVGAAPLNVP